MRKGTILLETLISVALFSVIALYTVNIVFNLSKKNHSQINDLNNILKLETTRLFIQKHTLSNIRYENNSLIYNNKNILLDNVSAFSFSKSDNIWDVNICLDKNTVCQNWAIK